MAGNTINPVCLTIPFDPGPIPGRCRQTVAEAAGGSLVHGGFGEDGVGCDNDRAGTGGLGKARGLETNEI